MKIVFATGIFPPDIGGPATYVQKLTIELLKQGCEIKVITYADKGALKSQIPNPKFQIIKISRAYPGGLRHLLYFLNLLWLAKDANVIYAQNPTSSGLPVLLAAKLLGKKFVLKVVGDAAWEQKKGYLGKIQRYVVLQASQIIVPSQYVKKMVTSWGAPESKIKVIYNALGEDFRLDISKEEAKRKIGIDGDIILSVGRLVSWKGFSTLAAILPDLLKDNPFFQLVIIGEGPEREKIPTGENISLLGEVEHSQIPVYYRAASIFVLNSGYEGLSHVILEAMSFGVPVVASNEGGNPELIEDGFNGFLVEYNNREQLKEAILKVWQDKDLQEKFIRNSKEKLKEFSWEKMVYETEKCLVS